MFRQLGAALEVKNRYSRIMQSASLVFLSLILVITLSTVENQKLPNEPVNLSELSIKEREASRPEKH